MKTLTTKALLSTAALAAGVSWFGLNLGASSSPAQVPDQPERTVSQRAQFMRVKLDRAKDVLEGLTLEDYDKIVRASRSLRELSMAAEWEVPTLPRLEYVAMTEDFQRRADALGKAARESDLDAATHAFAQLTESCVICHKRLRAAQP